MKNSLCALCGSKSLSQIDYWTKTKITANQSSTKTKLLINIKCILKTFRPIPKTCRVSSKPFQLSRRTVVTCLFVTLLAANLAAKNPINSTPGSNYLPKRLSDQIDALKRKIHNKSSQLPS